METKRHEFLHSNYFCLCGCVCMYVWLRVHVCVCMCRPLCMCMKTQLYVCIPIPISDPCLYGNLSSLFPKTLYPVLHYVNRHYPITFKEFFTVLADVHQELTHIGKKEMFLPFEVFQWHRYWTVASVSLIMVRARGRAVWPPAVGLTCFTFTRPVWCLGHVQVFQYWRS